MKEKIMMTNMYDQIAKDYYSHHLKTSWKDFNTLRNIMAHGSVDNTTVVDKYLRSEEKFKTKLRMLLNDILKDIVPRKTR